jgi:SMI1 / KNR4 family (SUKH-1)
MEENFRSIRVELQRLQDRKSERGVFGSDAHRFELFPPVTEETISRFEQHYRITLPTDYRGFLIQVGNGGAGPAYGLFPLGEIEGESWRENDGLIGTLSLPFPHTGPWNDQSGRPEFDEDQEDDPNWEHQYQADLSEWEKRHYHNPKFINGAIPICHLGCASRQWLVVQGPETGHIWNDFRADSGGLKPVEQPGRNRVTFLQWYLAWLQSAAIRL